MTDNQITNESYEPVARDPIQNITESILDFTREMDRLSNETFEQLNEVWRFWQQRRIPTFLETLRQFLNFLMWMDRVLRVFFWKCESFFFANILMMSWIGYTVFLEEQWMIVPGYWIYVPIIELYIKSLVKGDEVYSLYGVVRVIVPFLAHCCLRLYFPPFMTFFIHYAWNLTFFSLNKPFMMLSVYHVMAEKRRLDKLVKTKPFVPDPTREAIRRSFMHVDNGALVYSVLGRNFDFVERDYAVHACRENCKTCHEVDCAKILFDAREFYEAKELEGIFACLCTGNFSVFKAWRIAHRKFMRSHRKEAVVEKAKIVEKRSDPRLRIPEEGHLIDMSYGPLEIKDTNPEWNRVALTRDVRTKEVKLFGQVHFGTYSWPTLVACEERLFRRCLLRARNENREELRKFLSGILTPEFFERNKVLFTNLIVPCQDEERAGKIAMYKSELCAGAFSEGETFSIVTDENLELVESFSFIAGVINAVMNSDYVALATMMGMHARRMKAIFEIVSVGDARSFLELCRGTTLSADFETMSSIFDRILPSFVTKSPAVRRIAAFALVLVSSQWFSDLHAVRAISGLVNWEGVAEQSSVVETCWGAVRAIYDSLNRMWHAKSFKEIFDQPRDVAFIGDSYKLLLDTGSTDSVDVILEKMAKAKFLIARREYVVSTPEISRLLEKLRNYIVEKEKFIGAHKVRKPPFVVWLNGSPGSGKTSMIESVVNLLTQEMQVERFEGDVTYLNVYDKYPASTGCHTKSRFIVMNDIPSIYKDFPQRDLLPLDVLLQMIVDTSPLYFRAAAIEDKGMVLNDIVALIITSNHKSYACPGETEKLQRRLDDGIIVDMRMNAPGTLSRNKRYADVKNLPQHERNATTYFVVLKPECREFNFAFEATTQVEQYTSFFQTLLTRFREHQEYASVQYEKFGKKSNTCRCGVADVLHVSGDENKFVNLTDLCTIVPPPDTTLASGSRRNAAVLSVIILCVSIVAFIVLGFSNVMALCVFAYVVYTKFLKPFFYTVDETYDIVVYTALSNPFAREAFSWYVFFRGFDPEMHLRGFDFAVGVFKVKTFFRRHGPKIAVAIGSGFLYWLFRTREKKAGNIPIFSHQVDPSSITTTVVEQEMNFTPTAKRDWGKTDEVINFVKLFTMGISESDLCEGVKRATVPVIVRWNGKRLDAVAFALGPDWLALNKHYLQESSGDFTDNFSLEVRGILHVYKTTEFRQIPDCEVGLVRNHFLPMAAPMFKFLADAPADAHYDVTAVVAGECHKATSYPGTFYDQGNRNCLKSFEFVFPGKKGMCGHAVIGNVKGAAFIMGFISYIKEGLLARTVTGGSFMSREMYMRMVGDKEPVIDSRILCRSEFGPLSEKSEFRNVPSPFLLVLGSTDEPSRSFHSDFKKSRLYDDIAPKFELKGGYGIPKKVRGLCDDGVYRSAMQNTFKHINLQDKSTDTQKFVAVRAMVNKIDCRNVNLKPLTLEQAIFGHPPIGVDRVNFKSSCGRTLKTEYGIRNKYDMFEDSEGEYPLRLLPAVRDRIQTLIDSIGKGVLPVIMADMVPKDEVRPNIKLVDMKVRLFSVLDFDVNIVARMFLMPLIALLLDHRYESRCFGQMNAGSREWDGLGIHLSEDDRAVIDKDFGAFDTSHNSPWFLAIARFFFMLAQKVGYSPYEREMVYYCVRLMDVQMVRYLCDYVLKLKGMPSGWLGTLMFNSLVNLALDIMGYVELTGKSAEEYWEDVRCATVGDDNVAGVKREILDRYNMFTITELYREWGYMVTPASKGNLVVGYLSLSEAVFVKRRFVPSPFGFVAPLEIDSIWKPFAFENVDCGVSVVERLHGLARSQQFEAFLHGREFLEAFTDEVQRIFDLHSLGPITRISWEELETRYNENKFRTYDL